MNLLLSPTSSRWTSALLLPAALVALAPALGYDRAAELAKEAHATGRTVREICMERKVLPTRVLDDLLDARKMTG